MTIMANSAAASGVHVPEGWVAGTTGTDPTGSSVSAEIATASVSTGTHMRDDHLRSADFLDAGRYPVMKFSGGAPRPAGGGWVLAGDGAKIVVADTIDIALDVQAFAAPGSRGR